MATLVWVVLFMLELATPKVGLEGTEKETGNPFSGSPHFDEPYSHLVPNEFHDPLFIPCTTGDIAGLVPSKASQANAMMAFQETSQ